MAAALGEDGGISRIYFKGRPTVVPPAVGLLVCCKQCGSRL
nr:MAG TPA: hypothetical protein [Caudoviricetes sp.]